MIYVIPQFLLIGVCLFMARLEGLIPLAIIPMLLGILLGLWAMAVMLPAGFNIRPEPHEDARLVRNGPYAWIRHPMYSSVLLVCLGLVSSNTQTLGWLSWLALLLVLMLKLRYEEQLLSQRFPDYQDYMRQTRRLMPFVF